MENRMPAIPENAVLAMAYIPWQHLEEVYEPEAALANGTLFPVLNKPFTAGGSRRG